MVGCGINQSSVHVHRIVWHSIKQHACIHIAHIDGKIGLLYGDVQLLGLAVFLLVHHDLSLCIMNELVHGGKWYRAGPVESNNILCHPILRY